MYSLLLDSIDLNFSKGICLVGSKKWGNTKSWARTWQGREGKGSLLRRRWLLTRTKTRARWNPSLDLLVLVFRWSPSNPSLLGFLKFESFLTVIGLEKSGVCRVLDKVVSFAMCYLRRCVFLKFESFDSYWSWQEWCLQGIRVFSLVIWIVKLFPLPCLMCFRCLT